MVPIVTLVGRPNVGKSTLFNKLTRSRDALVADLAGLTRDRQYGTGRFGDFPFVVIDTGGLAEDLPEAILADAPAASTAAAPAVQNKTRSATTQTAVQASRGGIVESVAESGIKADASDVEAALYKEMLSQVAQAIGESDLVLFLVDGRNGLTPVDERIAASLRKTEVPVLLVVNKIDGVGEDQAKSEFYSLGMAEPVGISAAHNRGLQGLMSAVHGRLVEIDPRWQALVTAAPGSGTLNSGKRGKNASADRDLANTDLAPGSDAQQQMQEFAGHMTADLSAGQTAEKTRGSIARGNAAVAFIGRPNVGKSTLVNRLCGEERVVAFDQPGTTRDAIAVPFKRGGRDYTLIDTAGIRRRGKVNETAEKFSVVKALAAIEEANVCVYLLDARDSVTEQDLQLMGYIIDKGRALIVAINKWDAVSADERDQVRLDLERRVGFLEFTRLHFISALQGSGVNDLFRSIDRAFASAFVNMSTPELNDLLKEATTRHQPPMKNGRRIKLRHAHQGGVNPPIIVIHGNQTEKLPGDYRRFLVNFFQKELRLFGTPLKLVMKQSANPFSGSRSGGNNKSSNPGKGGARRPGAKSRKKTDGKPGRNSGSRTRG